MKQYVIIDVQDSFKTKETKDDIKYITDYLWKINLHQINENNVTIIYDTTSSQHSIDDNYEKLYEYANEFGEKNLDDPDIIELFKNGVESEIIKYIVANDEYKIIAESKEYGYFRNAMDSHPDVMFYFTKLIDIYDKTYDSGYFDEEELNQLISNNKEAQLLVNLCIENSQNIDNLDDILNVIEQNYLPYDNINRYNHIDKNDEIVLLGGSAAECVLEEYLYLKTLGYKNVSIDKEYIYGFYPQYELNCIDIQIEQYEEEYNKVLQLDNFENLSKEISKTELQKNIGVER